METHTHDPQTCCECAGDHCCCHCEVFAAALVSIRDGGHEAPAARKAVKALDGTRWEDSQKPLDRFLCGVFHDVLGLPRRHEVIVSECEKYRQAWIDALDEMREHGIVSRADLRSQGGGLDHD